MVPTPSEEDKQTVIETMNEVPSPLVYGPSLYGELELGHGMDYDVIDQAMVELQMADEIAWLCVSPDNEDNIPPSEYCYIPETGQEMPDYLE